MHTDDVGVTFILIATEPRLINTHVMLQRCSFAKSAFVRLAALIVMNEPFDYESSPWERKIEKPFDYTFSYTTGKCVSLLRQISISVEPVRKQ